MPDELTVTLTNTVVFDRKLNVYVFVELVRFNQNPATACDVLSKVLVIIVAVALPLMLNLALDVPLLPFPADVDVSVLGTSAITQRLDALNTGYVENVSVSNESTNN